MIINNYKHFYIVYITINILLISAIIFFLFPSIELAISDYFYNHANKSFTYKDHILVKLIYDLIPIFTIILLTFLLINLLIYILNFNKTYEKQHIKNINNIKFKRKIMLYIIITLLIGPTIMINLLGKNLFPRARPINITQFNGDQQYSKIFATNKNNKINYSFPSGHAAMGFYSSILAYLYLFYLDVKNIQNNSRNKYLKNKYFNIKFNIIYIITLIIGICVSLSRIMMGGHFISDVIVSGIIILSINHIIFLILSKK